MNALSLLKSWGSTNRDAEQFWRLTLKEIHIILEGEAERLKMEHDRAAKFAWHTAFMSAYAPQKPKDFWRLKSLLWKDKTEKRAATPWKDKFAAMANWVSSFKKP